MENLDNEPTIKDFGNQWEIHSDLDTDYWTSNEMFIDYLAGLLDPEELRDKVVLEVGSGSGRILRMLSRYNPKLLIGVEPSSGFKVLKQNTKDLSNLEIVNLRGDEYVNTDVDLVFSLGVIHHIPDAQKVVQHIYNSLKFNGKFIIWVYGLEGNRLYVYPYRLISFLTKRMTDDKLDILSSKLQKIVVNYGKISKKLFFSKLPMSDYIINVFTPCGPKERQYIVFDQLNPDYAKYYKKKQVMKLLEEAGFKNVTLKHRHAYSWTAVATK